MKCIESQDPFLQFSLEQAELVADYIRSGGSDPEFLRIHVTALLESVLDDIAVNRRSKVITHRYA